MGQISTVIFDIGNVLTKYRWKEYLESFGFDDKANENIANAVFLSEEWKECDRGVWSDQELLDAFCKNAPEYADKIRMILKDPNDLVLEVEYACSWIQELKDKGLKVYVLSNYGKKLFQYAIKNFKFLKEIDGGIISYEVNLIKPDLKIFQLLMEKYNFVASEAVFLDDTKENVDAAEKLGIKGIHVTSYDDAVKKLNELLM